MAKQRYTQEQVTTALEQSKGMVTVAARLLGCVPNTVQAYIDRYPQVAEARAQQREGMTDVAELALYKAIQSGEAWAVCFYLKTQGKSRGYVERVEQQHSGTITQEHAGVVEVRAVDYRQSIRALAPPEPEELAG
jgi:hypothetical protein